MSKQLHLVFLFILPKCRTHIRGICVEQTLYFSFTEYSSKTFCANCRNSIVTNMLQYITRILQALCLFQSYVFRSTKNKKVSIHRAFEGSIQKNQTFRVLKNALLTGINFLKFRKNYLNIFLCILSCFLTVFVFKTWLDFPPKHHFR